MRYSLMIAASGGVLLALTAACGSPKEDAVEPKVTRVAGTVYAVKDTMLAAAVEASGTAAPLQQATLSTKLMGTVLAVLVSEGDAVVAGQPLVRIDARELAAKQTQVAASIAEAEAIRTDALTQASRIRALYADSAATRAQLDAAETALARAEAAARAAHASSAELGAVSDYATVRAPFSGIVTKRFVDPGAFAAPGAPLLAVQDGRQLRIAVHTTPHVAGRLRRGQVVDATIETRRLSATIEGIVPADAGNLYTINAIVANGAGTVLPGSTATLMLPSGTHAAIVVPAAAITRAGDLTGVVVRTPDGDETRWVRLGASAGGESGYVEVSAGLRAGDKVVVPLPVGTDVAERN